MDSSNTPCSQPRRNRPRAPGSRRAVYGGLYDPVLDIRLRRTEPFGYTVESILKTLQRDKNKTIAAGERARNCLYSYGTGYNALRWLREHGAAACIYAGGRSWYAWKEPAAGSRAYNIMAELGLVARARPAGPRPGRPAAPRAAQAYRGRPAPDRAAAAGLARTARLSRRFLPPSP